MYAKKAIVAREEQLVFANLVNRVFEEDATFGASIKVHSVGNLAAQTKATSDNAATIYETITESDKTITIGTWEYQGIAVETFTEVQADRDLIEMYAPKQGYALALSMDTTIAGLPDDFTNNVGTLIVELTYDDVLRARQYLDDANAPQEDRWWIVSPAQEAGFLKLDHYSNKDYGDLHGVPTAKPVQRAYIGTWLNIPIFKTTNVEGTNAAGHDNVLMQREGPRDSGREAAGIPGAEGWRQCGAMKLQGWSWSPVYSAPMVELGLIAQRGPSKPPRRSAKQRTFSI